MHNLPAGHTCMLPERPLNAGMVCFTRACEPHRGNGLRVLPAPDLLLLACLQMTTGR